MRVLIACEFSQVVTKAFRELGHEAFSCDLLPTEGNPDWHIQGDVLPHLNDGWDLIIAHPPCTYLCNSGVRWLVDKNGNFNEKRRNAMHIACDFFAALYYSNAPKICIENPIMHKYAKSYLLLKHGVSQQKQTIQPFEHGEPESKRTCLWLRGLPDLNPSNDVHEQMMNLSIAERSRVHYASPGKDRWKERSRTLPGIGRAMAAQWSNL